MLSLVYQRTSIVKHLIKHHRATYAPFVVAMYSERQYIINDNNLQLNKNEECGTENIMVEIYKSV